MNWRSAGFNPAYLPVIITVLCAGTFATTYTISVYRGEIDAILPYISDTANGPLTSRIFSLSLNVIAFLGIITIYIRYRFVEELNHHTDAPLSLLNLASLITGCISSIGLAVLANFGEFEFLAMHVVGASAYLGIGIVYSGIQTIISWKMYPTHNGLALVMTRLILTVLGVHLLVIGVISALLSKSRFQADNPDGHVNRPWTRTDRWKAGYDLHVVSALCECLYIVVTLLYLLTYSHEFNTIQTDLQVQSLTKDPERKHFAR